MTDDLELDGVRLRGGFVIAPDHKRECNRHSDCDAADAKAHADWKAGKRRGPYTDHCYDEGCEDCFGS